MGGHGTCFTSSVAVSPAHYLCTVADEKRAGGRPSSAWPASNAMHTKRMLPPWLDRGKRRAASNGKVDLQQWRRRTHEASSVQFKRRSQHAGMECSPLAARKLSASGHFHHSFWPLSSVHNFHFFPFLLPRQRENSAHSVELARSHEAASVVRDLRNHFAAFDLLPIARQPRNVYLRDRNEWHLFAQIACSLCKTARKAPAVVLVPKSVLLALRLGIECGNRGHRDDRERGRERGSSLQIPSQNAPLLLQPPMYQLAMQRLWSLVSCLQPRAAH